jgi:hypothetical protein
MPTYVFMHQMVPAYVGGVVVAWSFPGREDVVTRVPELVLGGGVNPAKPPGDHLASAVGHVSCGCNVCHAVFVESPSGLYGLIGGEEEEFGVLETEWERFGGWCRAGFRHVQCI